jgi:hypothetical protein
MVETKSRYEVIAELEKQKRDYIRERDGMNLGIMQREQGIKEKKRELEDLNEELKFFKSTIDERKIMLKELIASVDDSLKRFEKLQQN